MTESIPAPRLTVDDGDTFVRAVSLCAELEKVCGNSGSARLLSRIGMARSELTEYGARVPSRYEEAAIESIDAGLQELERMLTSLLRDADGLAFTLRLHEAREVVREGLSESS